MSRSRLLPMLEAFGPLIIFYGALKFWGLRPAVLFSILYCLAEVAYRKLYRRQELGSFFIFSAIVTVGFGCVDLYLAKSVLFQYEAALTNLVTGGWFGLSAFARRPMILEFAEKSGRIPVPASPELVIYFRWFTLVWAAYFVAKGVVYAALAWRGVPLEDQMLLRMALGTGSLFAMMGVSMLCGRWLFLASRRLGLLRLFPGGADLESNPDRAPLGAPAQLDESTSG